MYEICPVEWVILYCRVSSDNSTAWLIWKAFLNMFTGSEINDDKMCDWRKYEREQIVHREFVNLIKVLP